jgi:hypothetical protein
MLSIILLLLVVGKSGAAYSVPFSVAEFAVGVEAAGVALLWKSAIGVKPVGRSIFGRVVVEGQLMLRSKCSHVAFPSHSFTLSLHQKGLSLALNVPNSGGNH